MKRVSDAWELKKNPKDVQASLAKVGKASNDVKYSLFLRLAVNDLTRTNSTVSR